MFDIAFLGRHAHQLRSEMMTWPISEVHRWVKNTSKLIELEYPKDT